MNQSEFIYDYNDKFRDKFNPDFFKRSEDDIIEELKKIILSCQRDKFFTIKVMGFKVIDDYKEINETLYNYEEAHTNKNKSKNNDSNKAESKGKKKENQYGFINLKDSDIKLLVVTYFIKIKDESEYLDVIIAVPRIVDKYYFRLSGNTYSAMYQIVDASTYNNTNSNSKKHSVTLKTMFMPIRLYRNSTTNNANNKHLKTTSKEIVKCTYFMSNIFNKSVHAAKYIFAKFGLYGTLKFFNIGPGIFITDTDPCDDKIYTFCKHPGIFINSPKYIFDNDIVVQSLVFTIHESIFKDTKFNDLPNQDFWVNSLGLKFGVGGVEKGLSILDSLECIYDRSTKESIHLPPEVKDNIYLILKWMMGEFNNLKIKNNLDISTKKIRCPEYIASLYAMRLSTGIYRVSDKPNRAKLSSIKKAIITAPMALIGLISKCQLVNYRNMVNDTDSLTALKFTYKGISGIGEKSNNSVPNTYRSVNISHLGRVDLDSSSATDPGITGTLCPLGKLCDDKSFSEFMEPNTWDIEFGRLLANYKALIGMKELMHFKKQLDIEVKEDEGHIDESIRIMKKIISPLRKVEEGEIFNGIVLEEGGNIYYE